MNIIYARNTQGYIGKENQLLYNFKKDMVFFREKTTGNTLIFGYRSFMEIGKPLKNRKTIVIVDKKRQYNQMEGVKYVSTIQEAIEVYNKEPFGELFVCGGKSIYDDVFKNYHEQIKKIFETVVLSHDIGDTKVSFDTSSFRLASKIKEVDKDRCSEKYYNIVFKTLEKNCL